MKIIGGILLMVFTLQLYGQNQKPDNPREESGIIKGIVFHDKNGNGIFDSKTDVPLKDVAVSNGRDIVLTKTDGSYHLKVQDPGFVFVIKPKNWGIPVNEFQIPRFYYTYAPKGLEAGMYKGVDPTGEIPGSVDFALYPQNEPGKFNVLVFGDTQPRTLSAVHYFFRDIVEELIGIDSVAFGVTLGDVVSDFLHLFDPMKQSVSALGIPWNYVIGNHDLEHSLRNDKDARGPWYRDFGPTYYSFSYGNAHFIVLDNIRLIEEGKPVYKTGLGKKQMEFLQNELSRLDKNQLIFIMAHIPWEGSTPWYDDSERTALYKMLAEFKNSVSLVAHTHEYYHHFIDKEQGFPGNKPHHMISIAAVCGSWWMGIPDEYGIPHALAPDGTPKGYTMLHVDGNDWKISWKASRRPANFQMSISVPDELNPVPADDLKITAHIYNALPSASVEMKIGEKGNWIPMKRVRQPDPLRTQVYERETNYWSYPDSITYWRRLNSGGSISENIWEAKAPDKPGPGIHVIYVRAADKWWNYEGKRLVHIK